MRIFIYYYQVHNIYTAYFTNQKTFDWSIKTNQGQPSDLGFWLSKAVFCVYGIPTFSVDDFGFNIHFLLNLI